MERVIETLERLYRCIDADELEDLSDEDIAEALNIYVSMIEGSYGARDLDKIKEQAEERLNQLPLSVSVKRVMTVQLSWGGPSDEFEVEIDDGELQSNPVYIFKDWFDGARRETNDASVERFLEGFAQGMEVE